MATVIRSLGINGISGYPLGVEVAIIAGLQVTNIVGLGDIAVISVPGKKSTISTKTSEIG